MINIHPSIATEKFFVCLLQRIISQLLRMHTIQNKKYFISRHIALGNPTTKMRGKRAMTPKTKKKPTSASEWKKASVTEPTLMPSGKYMVLRKVGLTTLISMGMMPNSLMGFAQKAVNRGQGKKAEALDQADLAALVTNPEMVAEIGEFMDKLFCFSAREPQVHPLPPQGVERDGELLYIDEIDEEDKMFVFQVVTGGTTDVESFRGELATTLASVRGSEDVELPAE